MNFVHAVLYLHAEDEHDAVAWGLEVFDTRDKALAGACAYLEHSGYSAAEVDFARAEIAYSRSHTASSLGLQVILLMPEVQ